MAIHSPARGNRSRPSPHVSKHAKFPSPVGGVDSRVPVSSNDPKVCIYAYNIVPSEYGLRVRNGFREWQIGVTDGAGIGIQTIIPFEGNIDGGGEDRLFAVNNEGIWDVTVDTGLPILKLAFVDTSNNAGRGTYAHYIDDADAAFLLYADSVNGLFEYSSSTDTWAVASDITGVAVEDINFVVVHKLRIWFCTRNSSLAWYLPIGSRKGIAESFNYGGKFSHGGNLIGLYNWTVDGGEGVDDYLIAVSGSGDVLPYRGSDPTQATWSVVGTYFIGSMADGSRCCSQYGGDVWLLSTFGITQMSDLLRGVDPRAPNKESIGSKIAPIIRTEMPTYRNDQGWDIKYLQAEGVTLITSPVHLNGEYIQYVYNNSVGGWGFWRGVPMTAVDVWENYVYFGTEDGRIMVMDVSRDNVLQSPAPGEINGDLIEFSLLHNYIDLDDPSIQKRGKLIRPDFLSNTLPSYAAKFLYDYSIAELTTIPFVPQTADSLWDVSIWDTAIWGDSSLRIFDRVIGGSGIGRYISVAIKGKAVSKTVLASTDITWDTGWFL